jgi:hypothetical protein
MTSLGRFRCTYRPGFPATKVGGTQRGGRTMYQFHFMDSWKRTPPRTFLLLDYESIE